MMTVLGSTYKPIMHRLAAKIQDVAHIHKFAKDRQLSDQLIDVDILMLGHQKVTADDLAGAPRLKLIHQHGRGIDGVDLGAATTAGVTVANVPEGNSIAVAEHTLALILAQAKRLNLAQKAIADRLVGAPCGLELRGKTLLIIGLGAAGAELARLAKALGMRVLATKRRPELQPNVSVDALGGPDDLHRFLSKADFVVLLTILTSETHNLISMAELNLMRPTAYLINAARGALVDYDALLTSLLEGTIAGAAFDTFWSEPANPDDPILALDRFLLTPHVAGFSDVSIDYVTDVVAYNIHSLQSGEALINVANIN